MNETDLPMGDWPAGTAVSISRLPGPGRAMARALGIGRLLDPLRVGKRVRIRLAEDRAFTLSAISDLSAPDSDRVRVTTENSEYELRRVSGAPSSEGTISFLDALDESLASDAGHDPEATSVVHLDPEPDGESGGFENGARVWVRVEREGESRDLGIAVLLGTPTPGDSMQLSTDAGVIGTSRLVSVKAPDDETLEVATRNTLYTLRIPRDDGSDA